MKINYFAYIVTLPQYLIPHHLLSRLIYQLTRLTFAPWKNFLIKFFVKYYQINLAEAELTNHEDYINFNHFFTRSLNAAARPIAKEPNAVISPVDAKISASGTIFNQTMFQAKGHDYLLSALLGGDSARVEKFLGGSFITCYLSPRDYHRIHMPISGRLREMVHIPGRLFAVNDHAVNVIPNLFAINERVITIFDTAVGPMALILVGALFVGSIETVWAGAITPSAINRPKVWTYPDIGNDSIILGKGLEMGRFNMGSTVIILFGAGAISLEKDISTGKCLRMGEKLGTQLLIAHHGI